MSPQLIACHECDLLIEMPHEVVCNQTISCPRCGAKQYTHYKNAGNHTIAFSFTALILLAFPFLSFDAQGQVQTMSILAAALDLYSQGFILLASLVFAFVLLIPMTYLLAVLSLLVPIKLGFEPPFKIFLGKLISTMLPWAMAEVFIVGVLVALVKIIELADVIFGISFWAYAGFALFFVAASNIGSKRQLWRWISRVPS